MHTLSSFYKSKEWESFRRVVIAERTDTDGFVRCWHCGEPIVHKYDLIVHHVEELSESNVNDALVSLNPENCVCVHHRCHNIIHERFEGKADWKPKPRRVYVVYGAPCSGKTTWVRDNSTAKDLIVDIDSIWACVTGLPRYTKPERLKPTVFAIRDALYDEVKYRAGRWQDAYIITGGALAGERKRLVRRVGADEALFIDTDKQTCLERLSWREGITKRQMKEWQGYIDDWFASFQPD